MSCECLYMRVVLLMHLVRASRSTATSPLSSGGLGGGSTVLVEGPGTSRAQRMAAQELA